MFDRWFIIYIFAIQKVKAMNRKLIILISLFLICFSCTTIKEVPVETIKKEYIYIHSTDTIFKDKLVYIKDKGDTVYIYDKEYIYKYKSEVDTFLKTDTINIVVYKDKIVEVNKLKDWQISFMLLGGVLIGLIVLKFVKFFKKW